jgi:hypothetical protein
MTEQEAKKKAMEILRPVETRLYAAEWRNLMLAIQDERAKAFMLRGLRGAYTGKAKDGCCRLSEVCEVSGGI